MKSLKKILDIRSRVQLSSGFKQNVIYGIGLVFNQGLNFLLLPYLTRVLKPAEYGVMQLLFTIDSLGGLIIGLGIMGALLRYGGKAKNEQEQHEISSSATTLALITSFSIGLILISFATYTRNLLPAEVEVSQLQIVIANFTFTSINLIVLAWLRLINKAYTFLMITSAIAILRATITVLALSMGYGINGVLYALLFSNIFGFVILLQMLYRKAGIKFNLAMNKKLIIYGLPLIFIELAHFAVLGLDQIWLAKVVGVAEMAQYALASKFAMIVYYLLEPFDRWWAPRRFTALQAEDGINIAARIASMGTTLSMLLAVVIGIGGAVAIRLLTPPSYHQACAFVPWLTFMVIIETAGRLLNLGVWVGRTTYLPAVIKTFCGILAVALFYYLIPLYGILGAIISMYIVHAVQLAVLYFFSQRLVRLPYPITKLVFAVVLSSILLFIGSLSNNYVWQVSISIFSFLSFSYIAMRLGLLPKPREIINVER